MGPVKGIVVSRVVHLLRCQTNAYNLQGITKAIGSSSPVNSALILLQKNLLRRKTTKATGLGVLDGYFSSGLIFPFQNQPFNTLIVYSATHPCAISLIKNPSVMAHQPAQARSKQRAGVVEVDLWTLLGGQVKSIFPDNNAGWPMKPRVVELTAYLIVRRSEEPTMAVPYAWPLS